MMRMPGKSAIKRKCSKFLSAAVAGGVLLWGGGASAAPAEDAMWAFREAYLATSNDTRTLRESLQFFGPAFHADVSGKAQLLRDGSMRMEGTINWTFTDLEVNQTSQTQIPFYIEQSSDDMTLYAKRGGKWTSLSLPGIPAGVANDLKTNDVNTLKENMTAVKSVELLKDTPQQRAMRITLDGPKTAELFKQHMADDISGLSDEDKAAQTEFLRRLANAFQSTDLVINWAVDKSTWQTVTAGVNFTDLMRAYARGILQEAADGTVEISDEERKLLDALGYYSELQTYTSYVKDGAPLSVPASVKNAAVPGDVFQDMKAEAAASVK